MNRFIIENSVDKIAKSLNNWHVCKQPTEEMQMLCGVLWKHAHQYAEDNKLPKLRKGHSNHPCTLWAGESRANYRYAVQLYHAMLKEHAYRYPKSKKHGAGDHYDAIVNGIKYLPDTGNFKSKHPQCFSGHDDLKTDEVWPVEAYRAYYRAAKLKNKSGKKAQWSTKWNGRTVPKWITQNG